MRHVLRALRRKEDEVLRKPAIGIIVLASGACTAPAAAATLVVGPGQMFVEPCAAIAAAHAGDIVQVDASGNYAGDTCSWSTDNLTITGVNGRAKIDLTGVAPSGGKGIFTIEGTASATIENFELSGAAISAADGNNGAGIRHQGLNLTVRNCFIHDNQDGILGGPATPNTGTVLIENSEFSGNGAGDGFSHNMYIGNYAKFMLEYSYSHGAKVGHLVKSRAYSTYILYNRLTDETGGTASYEADIPNAGTAYVIGNIIEQSATTQNPTMLTFGEEGVPAGYDAHLFVVNNTFMNALGSGIFVDDATTTPADLTNDIFYGGGTITNQVSAVRATNFDSSQGDPMFVDLASYDLNLEVGSPCIDHGSDPGTSGNQSLAPTFEYVHPLSEDVRVVVGAAIDIGAYEYDNPADASTGGGPADAGAEPSDAGTEPVDVTAGWSDGASAGGRDGGGGPSTDAQDAGGLPSAARQDGGDGAVDGDMNDASVMSKKASSGCGCGLVGASPDARLGLLGAAMLAMAMLRRVRGALPGWRLSRSTIRSLPGDRRT